MTPADLYTVLLVALVVASVLDWYVVWILWSAHRLVPSPVLRERFGVGIVTAFVVTSVTVFGVAFDTGLLAPTVESLILRRILFLALGLIPLRFLYLFMRGRL